MAAVGVRPAAKRKRFGEWAGAANRVPDVSRAFENSFQPQIPVIGATWRRDSHKRLLWNGVNAARKFDCKFNDARPGILAGLFAHHAVGAGLVPDRHR
jgi:hypothetical protein